jgi:predicted sulfurtransferase
MPTYKFKFVVDHENAYGDINIAINGPNENVAHEMAIDLFMSQVTLINSEKIKPKIKKSKEKMIKSIFIKNKDKIYEFIRSDLISTKKS